MARRLDGSTQTVASDDIVPDATGAHNLGSATSRWDTVYADTADATLLKGSSLSISGAVTLGGTFQSNGPTTTLGNSLAADTVIFTSRLNSHLLPKTNVTHNLGETGVRYATLFASLGDFSTGITINGVNVCPTAVALTNSNLSVHPTDGNTVMVITFPTAFGSINNYILANTAVLYSSVRQVLFRYKNAGSCSLMVRDTTNLLAWDGSHTIQFQIASPVNGSIVFFYYIGTPPAL